MDNIVKKILLKVAAVFCIQIMVLTSVCFPVFAGNGKSYICEKAHTFDGGEVTKEPTCTEPGTTKFTCVDCGFVLEDNNFPLALGHCADSGKLHKGTKDVSGYVQYHCVRCGIDMGLIPVNTDGIVFPEEKVKKTVVANQSKEDTEVKANDEAKSDDVNAEETKDKSDEEIADAEKFSIDTLLSSESTAGEKLTDKEKKDKRTKAWEFIESLYRKGHNPVRIRLNDSTLVPSKVFLLAKEYNTTTELIVNDKVSWTILPGEIDAESMEKISRINVGVIENSTLIPNEVASSAENLQNRQLLNKVVDIKHGGSLGFIGLLSVKLNDITGSEYANVFLYNEDENTIEYISSMEIPSDRVVRFNVSKGATYALYTSRLPMNEKSIRVDDDDEDARERLAKNKQAKMDEAKKQSEANPISIGIIIVVIAVAILIVGMLFFQKKGDFDISSFIKKDK